MGITEVEHLDDRVRVHYHLGMPDGVANVDTHTDVKYEDIPCLPNAPDHVGIGWTRKEFGNKIYVPAIDKTIMFIIDSYQERSAGPNEESLYGPYLVEDTPKQSA